MKKNGESAALTLTCTSPPLTTSSANAPITPSYYDESYAVGSQHLMVVTLDTACTSHMFGIQILLRDISQFPHPQFKWLPKPVKYTRTKREQLTYTSYVWRRSYTHLTYQKTSSQLGCFTMKYMVSGGMLALPKLFHQKAHLSSHSNGMQVTQGSGKCR